VQALQAKVARCGSGLDSLDGIGVSGTEIFTMARDGVGEEKSQR